MRKINKFLLYEPKINGIIFIMTIKQFLRIVYMPTKVISMGTFFSGTLFALYTLGSLNPTIVILMGFATLFVDMGTTGFNTYFDYKNGTDRQETNCEDDKVLVYEGVDPSHALMVSVLLFVAAAILGLSLAYLTNWKLLIVGGVCMLVGYVYTGGPYPISRTPLGELFAGFFLGTVLFLISFYVQTKVVTKEAFLASLPFLIVIGMILTVNNSCDRISDAKAGRRTLTIVMGKWGTTFLLACEGVLFIATILTLYFLGIYPIILLIAIIPSFVFGVVGFKKMISKGFSNSTKQVNMGIISPIYVVFSLCFSIGSLLSHFLA